MERKYLELVQDSFTQEHFDKQAIENKPYVAYSVKDKGVIYTIVPNESGTMYTVYRVVKKDISGLEYNAVDLGLPSGLKWADRNVGATDPEEYGSYFQWGDTEGFTYEGKGEITAAQLATVLQLEGGDEMEVTADNVHDILTMMSGSDPGYDLSIFGLGASLDKVFNWDNYFDTTDGGSTFNKYATDKSTVLESGDDAATVNMGSEWKMPTTEEIRELINNTTPTFIDLRDNEFTQEEANNDDIWRGNLKGVRFTAENGNSIFIPAAGDCDIAILDGMGYHGSLWSSSLGDDYSMNGRALLFYYDGDLKQYSGNRYFGHPIRGVKP